MLVIWALVYILYTMSFIRKIKKGDKTYLAEVENRWENGKCVQKHIRYVGKEADGKTILSTSLSNVEVTEVKLYGPLLVLHHLAKEINLPQWLGPYHGEILSMVYAHCLDYQSMNQMANWFERTDLNLILSLEQLTQSRLLSALDWLESQDSERLQKNIFHAVQQRYDIQVSGVMYDVTNTYFYGRHCSMAKLGHDKENVKGRPLIQVGLGVTEAEGFPLFHKVFDGNVHDARTLHDMITGFRKYDVRSGMVVYFDRGVTSAENLKNLKKMRWNVICGVPIREGLKSTLRPLLGKDSLVRLKNRVRLQKTVFYTTKVPYEMGGVKGQLVLCFNESQQRRLRESRYDEIFQAQSLLEQGKQIKAGMEKYFSPQGKLLQHKVAAAEEYEGYSCIFSSRRMATEKIVRSYFDKDLVEKAFRTIKGVAQLRPVRHWLYNRVTAHVFLCYLAYLLLSLLKYRLRTLEMQPESALRELSTMYKVYLRDSKKGFELSRTVALTKKQEAILRAVDRGLLNTNPSV